MNITRFAVAVSAIALSSGAWAQDHDARRADLLRRRERIDAELRALDTPAAARPSSTPPAATGAPDEGEVVVTARALSLTIDVTDQTGHTGYRTGTINAYGTYALGDRDRVAAKVMFTDGPL